MRKLLAAAGFGLVLGVAGAAGPGDPSPEARAYLGFSFGGERVVSRDFHYGLRLDHDPRFTDGAVPPLVQFDFTRHGLSAARVNGLSVVRQRYQLRQTEESAAETPPAEQPAEAPAEPAAEVPAEGEAAAAEGPGFWGSIGNFFGGLFGSDDEEPGDTAAADEAPAAEAGGDDVTEGTFLNYSVVDWGLLAVAAVGMGAAVGEISNGDESDDPGGGGGTTTGGTTTGGTTTGGTTTGGTLGGLAGGLGGLPGGLSGYTAPGAGTDFERDAEYRKWLDGGTGQMGDLGG